MLNDKASTYHKEVVLRYLLYTMPMNIRQELRVEHPLAYNEVCCQGKEVMKVTRNAVD